MNKLRNEKPISYDTSGEIHENGGELNENLRLNPLRPNGSRQKSVKKHPKFSENRARLPENQHGEQVHLMANSHKKIVRPFAGNHGILTKMAQLSCDYLSHSWEIIEF